MIQFFFRHNNLYFKSYGSLDENNKKPAEILLVALIAILFYRLEKNTAQGNHTAIFITETNPSVAVKLIFENTC